MSSEKLNWKKSGFDKFHIILNQSPPDGHCLIHSVASALWKQYRELPPGKGRQKLVINVRYGLSNRMSVRDPKTHKTLYESMSNGALQELSIMDEKYSIESYKKLLRSSSMLGYDILIILETVMNKNIFILDGTLNDVYARDNSDCIPDRTCVVIYYSYPKPGCGHFDMISVMTNNVEVSHFKFTHPFIKHLVLRLKAIGR